MKQFDPNNLTPFILYRGVIEDNLDPLEIKRVRVRIFGIHTENNENSSEKFEFIKTSELPWAEVMGGTDLGLIGGIGLSSVLLLGTWVWVILENNDPNKPIVIGTISGKNSKSSAGVYSSGKGFVDPDGVNPIRSSESDFNPLGRGSGTLSVTPKESEPAGSSPGSYPDNTVLETKSGHVIELDDTPGNERIRVYHKSGSYIEIKPDGSFVQKCTSTGESHYIHMSTVNEYIDKALNEKIKELYTIDALGKLLINGHVKIVGSLEVTTEVSSPIVYGNVVSDENLTLKQLKDAFDEHRHKYYSWEGDYAYWYDTGSATVSTTPVPSTPAWTYTYTNEPEDPVDWAHLP